VSDGDRTCTGSTIQQENSLVVKPEQASDTLVSARKYADPGTRSKRFDQAEGADLSPRARLVATLAETISTATTAGDLHAARVAHEALGRLLAEAEPGAPEVADLASERAKRGGKG